MYHRRRAICAAGPQPARVWSKNHLQKKILFFLFSHLASCGIGKPSLVHRICGGGLPFAIHFNETLGPG